jgi:hypothetical protein
MELVLTLVLLLGQWELLVLAEQLALVVEVLLELALWFEQ